MNTDDYPVDAPSRPGDLLGSRFVWFIVGTVVSLVVYSATVASKGTCAGGVGADGGFIDSAGNPTDAVPLCLHLELRPSGAIQVAIVLIAILGLALARYRSRDEDHAVRILGVALGAVAVVALGCLAAGLLWFNATSFADWDGSAHYSGQLPVVVANVAATITPMGSP